VYVAGLEPLTAAIIADMAPGEERGDAQIPGPLTLAKARNAALKKRVRLLQHASRQYETSFDLSWS
jgi:hypothetical protein